MPKKIGKHAVNYNKTIGKILIPIFLQNPYTYACLLGIRKGISFGFQKKKQAIKMNQLESQSIINAPMRRTQKIILGVFV